MLKNSQSQNNLLTQKSLFASLFLHSTLVVGMIIAPTPPEPLSEGTVSMELLGEEGLPPQGVQTESTEINPLGQTEGSPAPAATATFRAKKPAGTSTAGAGFEAKKQSATEAPAAFEVKEQTPMAEAPTEVPVAEVLEASEESLPELEPEFLEPTIKLKPATRVDIEEIAEASAEVNEAPKETAKTPETSSTDRPLLLAKNSTVSVSASELKPSREQLEQQYARQLQQYAVEKRRPSKRRPSKKAQTANTLTQKRAQALGALAKQRREEAAAEAAKKQAAAEAVKKQAAANSASNSLKGAGHSANPQRRTQKPGASGAYGVPSGTRDYRQLTQAAGNVPPQYPEASRWKGEQGRVHLLYYVTAEGRVTNVRVQKSSGHLRLDREAVRAIRKYRYRPGQAGQTLHPVTFDLRGEAIPGGEHLRTQANH